MDGITFIIVTVFSAVILKSGIRIDREYERGVIFRLGRFQKTQGPGMYFTVPMIDQKTQVDVRTKTVDIPPQEAVTADSVTIKINAVLYYRIIDPMKAIVRVENYQVAVFQSAMTTLRNIVGQHSLDELLQNRDKINAKVQEIVDEITEPWGVAVERVELKDVEIPISMQRSMAQEAEATREKRARLIKAQAEQEASTMLAEAAQKMMLTEIGAENSTTTVVMIPSDIINLAKEWNTAAHNGNITNQANVAAQISQANAASQISAANPPTPLHLPLIVDEIPL
jgi:regulator of protease activity HflC (stomatin/prohibitin superfamily)